MNISILIVAILLSAFYILFGFVAAYVDAIENGFKWYRFIFVLFFYWFIDLWAIVKMDR